MNIIKKIKNVLRYSWSSWKFKNRNFSRKKNKNKYNINKETINKTKKSLRNQIVALFFILFPNCNFCHSSYVGQLVRIENRNQRLFSGAIWTKFMLHFNFFSGRKIPWNFENFENLQKFTKIPKGFSSKINLRFDL